MASQDAELARLTAEVTELETVGASVVAFVEGLAQQIRDNKTNPVELAALADRLDSQANAISAAITANTPAQP